MAFILKEGYKKLYYFNEGLQICQIDDYFLMGSPVKILSILAFYWYFVKALGPKLMKHRQPFELRGFMMAYNALQVILNLVLGIAGLYYFFKFNISLTCQMPDYSKSKSAVLIAQLGYAYYMLKILDLVDTVIFVLRKRDKQISFLHVYHHILIAAGSYVHMRFLTGGHTQLIGLINTWVHAVMYAYYFMTNVSAELKHSLWWKKHITQLQMAQFAFLTVIHGYPMFISTCHFPRVILSMAVLQNVFMLAMFGDFYYKAYVREPKKIN